MIQYLLRLHVKGLQEPVTINTTEEKAKKVFQDFVSDDLCANLPNGNYGEQDCPGPWAVKAADILAVQVIAMQVPDEPGVGQGRSQGKVWSPGRRAPHSG